jgi:hypothetical protein
MEITLEHAKNEDGTINTVPLVKYPVRIVFTGTRGFEDYALFSKVTTQYIKDKKLDLEHVLFISGNAKSGADAFAIRYAIENNIDYILFNAQWDELGKSAGYIRNVEMSKFATAFLAFCDQIYKGTKHMIDICSKINLPTRMFIIKVDD